MLRALLIAGFASLVAISGCAVDTSAPDQEESVEQVGEAAGKSCMSSADCNANQYCTTEDGDCYSACKPGQPCIAVCTGFCKRRPQPAAGEPCGNVMCPSGQVCCNSSCGICTEPGGFCIQIACAEAI